MALKHLDHIVSLGYEFSHIFINYLTLIIIGHFLGFHYARTHGSHLRTMFWIDNRCYDITAKGGTYLIEQVVIVGFILLIIEITNFKCRTICCQSTSER